MTINNPPSFDRIFDTNGNTLQCKVLDIGAWNMDTQISKGVAHGLSIALEDFVSVMAVIENDQRNQSYVIDTVMNVATGATSGFVSTITTSAIQLTRTTGGFFDSTDYDDAVINRGTIFIWYKV